MPKEIGYAYLFLAVATPHIPSIAMAIAGATVPLFVPTNKIHAANTKQMIPTMNLSFLILSMSLISARFTLLRDYAHD
jgi:hypothetical protein